MAIKGCGHKVKRRGEEGTSRARDRVYRLVAVNDRTGKRVALSDDTLTLDEAYTMRSKFTVHRCRRILVEEVTS